jgi:light-regulated signal transduction histidine kinase (bacteriophytochrome)
VPLAEEKWLRLDGRVVEVAVAAAPVVLPGNGGQPLVQVIALDITGHAHHERELVRWNAELEHRVNERTAQLEAANQELEAFSYSVSHDLRAPLRHIDGFVEILRSHAAGQLDEEGRRHLQTIAQAAKRMSKLIDDLLTFSRMSRLRMSIRRVPPGTLVQDILHSAQPDLKGRRVEWIIGDLPEVDADPDMLRQAFFNLIDNALKYTRPRTVARIEIGATTAADEITFFIRDNGVGFDMRYVSKLFGVFQRLHRSTEFEGTGVGLANVRRIIHRHGGRTWAEGSVDAGATFYFSLPRPGTASPPQPSPP